MERLVEMSSGQEYFEAVCELCYAVIPINTQQLDPARDCRATLVG